MNKSIVSVLTIVAFFTVPNVLAMQGKIVTLAAVVKKATIATLVATGQVRKSQAQSATIPDIELEDDINGSDWHKPYVGIVQKPTLYPSLVTWVGSDWIGLDAENPELRIFAFQDDGRIWQADYILEACKLKRDTIETIGYGRFSSESESVLRQGGKLFKASLISRFDGSSRELPALIKISIKSDPDVSDNPTQQKEAGQSAAYLGLKDSREKDQHQEYAHMHGHMCITEADCKGSGH